MSWVAAGYATEGLSTSCAVQDGCSVFATYAVQDGGSAFATCAVQDGGSVFATQWWSTSDSNQVSWASFDSGNSQLFTFLYIHAPHNIKMSSEARCSKQHTHLIKIETQQSIPCTNLKLKITYYMHLEFISLQAHNPVDDAKEELKKDISNLRQEVMEVFYHSILDRPSLECFISIYPLTSFHILTQ